MGFFDVHCAASGLALAGAARLVPLIETERGTWVPAALPLVGSYDRYGCIDGIKGPNARIVDAMLREMALPLERSDLASRLGALSRGVIDDSWATWNGRRVSYSLFDDGVYRAIGETKREQQSAGASEPRDFTQVLFSVVDRDGPGRRYEAVPERSRAALQALAVELARFLSWPQPLAPIDVMDSQQYAGLHGERGCEARVRLARARFAGHRRVLAAIERNAAQWESLEDG